MAIVIAVGGIVSAFGVAVSAEMVLGQIVRSAQEEILASAKGGIALLDRIVAREVRELRGRGAAALLELEKKVPSGGGFGRLGGSDLRSLADGYGVDEIYLIGS
ncbi:MAG: hypothetical protein JNG85_08755, partial [Spirochaetaceae bacterium]|nr:hypothetical protein [Spirochaetaceae bacterium]